MIAIRDRITVQPEENGFGVVIDGVPSAWFADKLEADLWRIRWMRAQLSVASHEEGVSDAQELGDA